MTTFAETALAFARECLGWQDVEVEADNLPYIYEFETRRLSRVPIHAMKYRDIDDVLDRVWMWLGDLPVNFSLSFCGEGWVGEVWGRHGGQYAGIGSGPQLRDHRCEAIMAASVEFARKMKGVG